MMKIILVLCLFSFVSLCFVNNNGFSKRTTHKDWTSLLKKYVNKKGDVNYKGFIKDSFALNKYLQLLSNNAPDSTWTKNERFAYWLNAYNAFTVKLIVQNYPLKSIKDIGSAATNNSPWDKKFFTIGQKTMTLNIIEHEILRKQFNDPRLHFAINCASYSCPKLLNNAFEALTLDTQLNERARDFINDTTKNMLEEKKVQLSSIFLWYGADFTKVGLSKIDYLNKFSVIKIDTSATVSYLKYNWALNEQK
jgi:hypothetical protein